MTSDKIFPYGQHFIDEHDIAAVVDVLKGDFLTQGPAVGQFESAIAKYVGCKHAIVVNSGTAALHLAYIAMGLKPGDAVIVPAITFSATANAALYCGATPVFADVDPHSGLMTPETCQQAINRAKRMGLNPAIVVPVHIAGLPVAMGKIIQIAEDNGCKVFEDSCHAIGAEYRKNEADNWVKTGNWPQGSYGAAFSFHPVKHIATGEGGAIVTNNDQFAEHVRTLRTHGIVRNPKLYRGSLTESRPGTREAPWYHEMSMLGWNYRMPDILAALGASQMRRINQSVAKRILIATWYQKYLSDGSRVLQPVGSDSLSKHSWHLFPIRLNVRNFDRINFMKKIREEGVGSQVHYIPVPKMPFYEIDLKVDYADDLKGSLAYYDQELSLPMYPELTEQNIQDICRTIKSVLDVEH